MRYYYARFTSLLKVKPDEVKDNTHWRLYRCDDDGDDLITKVNSDVAKMEADGFYDIDLIAIKQVGGINQ